MNYENRVDAIRRKLAHVTLILNCEHYTNLTKKQLRIKERQKKSYGSVKRTRLPEVQANLKHDLKVQARILHDKKFIVERQRINTLFNTNTKLVYREFRKEKRVEVVNSLSKEAAGEFPKNIWFHCGKFNQDAEWLPDLREGYYRNVQMRINQIRL